MSAYEQGKHCYRNSNDCVCPYSKNSAEYRDWWDGFYDARAESIKGAQDVS